MSAYSIYFKDGAKMMRPILSREVYMSLRNSTEQRQILRAVRQQDTSLKPRLLQINYSCMPNENGSLKGCKTPSNSVGMDIDFVAPAGLSADEQQAWLTEQMEKVPELVLAKRTELGLLMLERSATKGFHVVFRRHAEMSQEENLHWASELLGVAFDKNAKDITRVFYSTSGDEDDLLFLDDELFSVTVLQCYSCVDAISTDAAQVDDEPKATPAPVADETLTYNGQLYSDIIAKYWELFNGGKHPVEGDRNALTFELAVTLRAICGYSLEKMLQVIPNYWSRPEDTAEQRQTGQAEWRTTIENALKEPRKGMSYRMRQVLQSLKSSDTMKACGGTISTPPPMPKRLPALIRLLIQNVPDICKPAVASAVFPALAAHLHGVKFRYWDNQLHEATFMSVLIGRQSIGKGALKEPVKYIMDDIEQRDIPNREREAEWKQKNPSAKQKKDPRPKDICIQMLIDNLTDAVFNQRVVDVDRNGQRYIYTIVDEIEALKKVTSRNSIEEVGLLIRKAFDNAKHGQERVGADSVSGIAPLRWNFNASTTPPNARRFFYKMVNDGTVSRLDLATIIKSDENRFEAPIQGVYDHQFAVELKPYIDRLESASGLIECPQAKRLSLEMKRENDEMSQLYDSEAYEVLSYRANVIAWLKGMLLYVAQGYKWDRSIADFVRWSQQYNLWCKMLYFGRQLEFELREEEEIQHQSGPQNLLDLLPDSFTRQQYNNMRANEGRSGDGKSTLRVWENRGHIYYDEVADSYCKTEAYKNRKLN